jgi:bifunctional ADP-heptose synthase (sugar kinase/adenylyltransferase)
MSSFHPTATRSTEIEPFGLLTPTEITAVLDKLSGASVAVVGDFCLDAYWTVNPDAAETSIETGRKTQPVSRQRYAPGGAGNVVINLVDLGVPRIVPVGVLGRDLFGSQLYNLLEHPHIVRDYLLIDSAWQTHTYIKPHVDAVELNRIDFGNFNTLAEESARILLKNLEMVAGDVSVVLVNHQVPGSMHDSETFRRGLAQLMEDHPEVRFIVDSRGYHEAYPRAVHKMNEGEVMKADGKPLAPGSGVALDELFEHATALNKRWGAPLIVTRGEKGCFVIDGDDSRQIFGVQVIGNVDPVGAGDTFVAALAATSAVSINLLASAFIANLAAAVTAQKLFQTGSASPSEILEMGARADFVYRPELAVSELSAQFLDESEIEVVRERPANLRIRHAIFDHDGTISTLREGWEQIMEPMMMRAILGVNTVLTDDSLVRRVRARVNDFINKTTGIQTIEQMHALRDIVLEFGYIPKDQVLDPLEYKTLYLAELKRLVDHRITKLERGETDIADYTVKGSVEFLKALRHAGITLYLASGTDDEDLRTEAQKLGYCDLFNGGIFGSLGEVGKDAKKLVLTRILHEVEGGYNQLISFGDGPVEMRETVKRGGYAVGVASDEVRRFGRNLEKRKRLVRAGACLVIPDFSQRTRLLEYLGLSSAS